MTFKVVIAATEFGRTVLLLEKSKLLGQAVELITFVGLKICITPSVGQLLIFNEDLVLTFSCEIETKIKVR